MRYRSGEQPRPGFSVTRGNRDEVSALKPGAAGNAIGTPTPRAHRDIDGVGTRKACLQRGARVGEGLGAVAWRGDDGPTVGPQHRDGVLDCHRPLKPEDFARDVVEDLRLGKVEVQALLESGGRLHLFEVLARQPAEVTHPVHLAVSARPDQAETTAV